MRTPLIATELRCDGRRTPLGIDEPRPRLSWAATGGGRGATTGAWRVEVEADGRPVWDSGRVAGDAHVVPWGGPALADRTRYAWRVQLWDGTGVAGPWSAWSWFETAFLTPGGFRPPFIAGTPAPDDHRHVLADCAWLRSPDPAAAAAAQLLLRTAIALPADAVVAQARLVLWMDGRADATPRDHVRINGRSRPAWRTLPPLRAPLELDLAEDLQPGVNHLALRSWADAGTAVIALVEVVLADGTTHACASGTHPWWIRPQADAQDTAGWDDPAAADWQPAVACGRFGNGPWLKRDRRDAQHVATPGVFRTAFRIDRPVTRARLYGTACGVVGFTLNGRRVGDRRLAPGWTDYRVRLHYQTEDVDALVRPGDNELQATVAAGWFSGSCFFGREVWGRGVALACELHLDHADGTTTIVRSDPATWQAGSGPVRDADLYHGQREDRRRAIAWGPARAAEVTVGALQAQPDEPVRAVLELPVRSLTQRGRRRFVADFGQNLAGVVRLRLREAPGTRVRLRFAEVLDLQGEPWTDNLRSARATDEIVCAGDGEEVFEPAFTFHGFRYCEISGVDVLRPEQLTAVVLASDLADDGAWSIGDPDLARLFENIRWGWRGNALSIPTDCPQRDERAGWTGDAQIFAATALLLTDAGPFLAKYQQDVDDAQHPSGAYPDVAPHPQPDPAVTRFGWGDAGIVIPWTLWRLRGDARPAERSWAAMRRHLDHRDARAVDDLNTDWSYGDWVSPEPQTPNAVLGPVWHAWMHRLMAELAEGLGRAADAAHHRARFAAVARAWRVRHLDADGRIAGSDTQCAYACALRAGVMPAELVPAAGRHLVAAVERAGWHLHCGFLGTGHLLPALSLVGRDDVAWRLLVTDTYPSWLYSVRNGATTVWERWNSYSPVTGPVNIGDMNSYNHYAFGAVGAWMIEHVIGLGRAHDDVGWRRMVLRPVPGGHCRHAAGRYRTPLGEAGCAWAIDGDRITLAATIPPGSTAEIHVPTTRPGSVSEGGRPIAAAEGIRPLRATPTHAVFAVGAGDYRFAADL